MIETGSAVAFISITKAKFDQLQDKAPSTLYFVEDSTGGNKIYLGANLYSVAYPDGDNVEFGS